MPNPFSDQYEHEAYFIYAWKNQIDCFFRIKNIITDH